jgi:hypothetical protein
VRLRKRIDLLPRRPAPAEPVAESVLIDQAVADGVPVVVTGPPGVGKSTELRSAAWRWHDEGAPVVFLDAAGQDVGDVLQQVFEACYDSAVYRPGPAELQRLMNGIRFRLVIDHFACPPQQWEFFLDHVPDARVVAAMADGDLPPGPLLLVGLRGLDRDAARRLLSRCVDRALREEDLPAADALWQAAGGRPGLLMAAAARSTAGALPSPAGLPGLLGSGLDRHEREIIEVLTLGEVGVVDPRLLPELLHTPGDTAAALRLLAALNLITSSERGYRLAAGVAGPLLQDLRAGSLDPVRICSALRAWAAGPQTPPAAIADHAPLITAAIDLAVRSGHPEAAGRLASTVAPALARSLRTGAWARVLDHGLAAARDAQDEPAQAYLAHEAGVSRLVTGEPEAAAGLFATAARIWDGLDNTTLAAIESMLVADRLERPTEHQVAPVPDAGPRLERAFAARASAAKALVKALDDDEAWLDVTAAWTAVEQVAPREDVLSTVAVVEELVSDDAAEDAEGPASRARQGCTGN